MVFVMRPLDQEAQTLGERLRLLRRTQSVSMDMLVAATRIQRRYLEALEWGRYDALPDPLYTRNFLRAYTRYLGADEEYFLELYAGEIARSDLLFPHRLPRLRVRKTLLFSVPHILAGIFVACTFLGVLGLLASRIYVVLQPPALVLLAPEAETVTTRPFVTLTGRVDDVNVTVRVGDVFVPLAPDGTFAQEVPLRIGPNTLEVRARARYSAEQIVTRTVVYQPE